MKYQNIVFGRFVSRPNRFIAHVEVNGINEICHVKNTSRLKELLITGVEVSLQCCGSSARKTKYDLIAVRHNGRWVNIDSQAPNKVFAEWLVDAGYFGKLEHIKPESVYGKSRFDFYLENESRKIYVEVKGVTLVEDGVAMFPGAPTQRGVKHVKELVSCVAQGFEAFLVFVVKRDDVSRCAPNDSLDPDFGKAVRDAVKKGVKILVLGCDVDADTLVIRRQLDIVL